MDPTGYTPLPFSQPQPTTDVSTSSTSTTDAPKAPSHSHIRSCTFCRYRKIRCDRQKPCTGCVRAGNECVYPPGPGRAPKRPRRALDARVLDRLSRLETLIKRLEGEVETGKPSTATPQSGTSATTPPAQQSDDGSISAEQLGRLVIDNTRSCYVSNILWASLGDEIEELRDLLHDPGSDDDENDTSSGAQTEESISEPEISLGCNAAILGFQALVHSLHAYHPPLPQSVALLEIFKENVVPLVHIFHMPTMIHIYWDAVAMPEARDRNAEALLFAIYYSTIISMEPEQCSTTLGVSRAYALKHYQFAVEQALARADLLNTQSMILLQAVVLFLSALRNEDASRTVWSLTALVFHIAKAMGLHRDGAAFSLRPLETELRRRLWWHICLLDIRSSEYHGCEPIVHESMFDTRLPLNINDGDLTAEMAEPPAEREEATEMTFCLIRCEVMRIMWKTSYVSLSFRRTGQPSEELSLEARAELARALQERLEDRYLKHCDTTIPFLHVCVTVARLIIARTWLVVYYPLCQKQSGSDLPTSIRDRLFLTSIKVLELSSLLLTNSDIARWTWHSKTHIQWHAVALVLSEICSRPPSADCDRAWEYVQTVYGRWKMKGHKGTLWRPIKRLMAKAQYVREMQKIDGRATKRHWCVARMPPPHLGLPTPDYSAGHIPSSSAAGTPGTASRGTPFVSHGDSVLTMEPLDPFCHMFFPPDGYIDPPDIDYALANWIDSPNERNTLINGFD
ncbi:hypothetical protein EYZ11_003552 [Aspergillus tanneri]|uniref:Zn(2)-C6 fungal-type domain-containing protein n=1 Tax=Aspergillus tanneri TaxID=1220188 RepID=A0A4V6RQW4_9EURO|nr:uncharacterized protein ATNIH1004_008646 [Aspergillus tanneri]KAA8644442.1 hypothetical protein ATNIH1004_008646 [Aspergillus tanneri]THC96944.1 hypothetical protein EYZ11_003552 [Aspergillus tanneri]